MRILAPILVLILTCPSMAGEVTIGKDSPQELDGRENPFGLARASCHTSLFRFTPGAEHSSPEAVVVRVRVKIRRQECVRDSWVPQEILFVEQGSTGPLLAIPLDTEEVKVKDGFGRTFTATNANATVSLDDFRRLLGKDPDFYLIYESGRFNEKWKAGYAEKVLEVGSKRR